MMVGSKPFSVSLQTSDLKEMHLFFRVISNDGALTPTSLDILSSLVPAVAKTTIVVPAASLESTQEQLDRLGASSSLEVIPFNHVGHSGRALSFCARQCRANHLLMLDDTLVGIAGSVVEAVQRLQQLSGPVKSLFQFDEIDGPLALQGGGVLAERAWLTKRVRNTSLKSLSSESWAGLGRCLRESLLCEPPSLYEKCEDARSDGEVPWLAAGLSEALKNQAAFVPWRVFGADPLALASWSIDSRVALEYLEKQGVSKGVIWSHLLRTVEPQVWHSNLRLLSIFDEHAPLPAPPEGARELTTAVIMHVFYLDMLDEMVGYANNVPQPASLFITTDTEEKALEIRAQLADSDRIFESVDVRVVASNQGRDIPAFFVDCADVLRDPKFDLVVKLHSKKSAQTPAVLGEYFKDHLFENLVGTRSQAAQIHRLFATEADLGIVFPPMIHMGYPTMGNGWMTNKLPAFGVARRLGFELSDTSFTVFRGLKRKDLPVLPTDATTPLAPYGSMYWARRTALLPLVDAAFQYEEFPLADAYLDGSLAHVLERLTAYTVYAQGFYGRSVQTISSAQFGDNALQAKLAAFDAVLSLPPTDQLEVVKSVRPISVEGVALQLYSSLTRLSPTLGRVGKYGWRGLAATIKIMRGDFSPLRLR